MSVYFTCMNSKNHWKQLVHITKNGLVQGRKASETFLQYGKNRSERIVERLKSPLTEHVRDSVQFLDHTLGVSEVSEAQEDVCIRENEFLEARDRVESFKTTLARQQEKLNETRQKLDRTERADEKYLVYVAEEHKAVLQVQDLRLQYEAAEGKERQHFVEYSSAVRLSHEKERMRVERTKYWSIIASVSGTILGFLLSSMVTQYRLKRIQDVTTSSVQDISDRLESRLLEHKEMLSNENNDTGIHQESTKHYLPTSLASQTDLNSVMREFRVAVDESRQEINSSLETMQKSLSQLHNGINPLPSGEVFKTTDVQEGKVLCPIVTIPDGDLNSGMESVQSFLSMSNVNGLLSMATFVIVAYSVFWKS